MKKTLLIFAFIICCIATMAQGTATVKLEAEKMVSAFIKGELNTLADYTYPKLVSMMGGKSKMVATVKAGIDKMKADGTTFRSGTIGQVSKIYSSGKELHCTIDQTLVMGVKGGSLTAESQLLGISADSGKSWTFLTLANLNSVQLKQFFPNFNKALVIKKAKPPVFQAE